MSSDEIREEREWRRFHGSLVSIPMIEIIEMITDKGLNPDSIKYLYCMAIDEVNIIINAEHLLRISYHNKNAIYDIVCVSPYIEISTAFNDKNRKAEIKEKIIDVILPRAES